MTQRARAAWNALLAGPLAGRRLTRLIVTHMHPDHIGLAGWLTEKFDIPLLTSQTAYIESLNLSLAPGKLQAPVYRDFYLRNGLDEATTALISTMGHDYLGMVAPLPPTFERLVAGDELAIGGRKFADLGGRRPCARAAHAVQPRGEAVSGGRPGARENIAQRQRLRHEPARRSARPLPALAGAR